MNQSYLHHRLVSNPTETPYYHHPDHQTHFQKLGLPEEHLLTVTLYNQIDSSCYQDAVPVLLVGLALDTYLIVTEVDPVPNTCDIL
jgi:hypothetical protein